MAKMKYMIAVGASVVIIRDGKRKPIPAGGGAEFTEEEIATINKGTPGALRTPINEGRGRQEEVHENLDDEDAAEEVNTANKAGKKAGNKNKTKPKAVTEKTPTPPAPEGEGEGDDADEDEDI